MTDMKEWFKTMLGLYRGNVEYMRVQYEEGLRNLAALERVSTINFPGLPQDIKDVLLPPKLTRRQRHAMRVERVLNLFFEHGGTLRLPTIMQALGLSKNAAKDWMNKQIDDFPETCQWERVNGNRSRFIHKAFRNYYGDSAATQQETDGNPAVNTAETLGTGYAIASSEEAMTENQGTDLSAAEEQPLPEEPPGGQTDAA